MEKVSKEWQEYFVRELAGTVISEISELIETGKVPETWAGVELRRYVFEAFQAKLTPFSGHRKRAYNQQKLERGL